MRRSGLRLVLLSALLLSPVSRALASDWTDLGGGIPGTSGVPQLAGAGALFGETTGSLTLTSARPSSSAMLFVSVASMPVPFKGGTLQAISVLVQVPLMTNASGGLVLPWIWPTGVPAGTPIHFQIAVQDPAASHGVSLSACVRGTAKGDLPQTLVPLQDFEGGFGNWTIFPDQPTSAYPQWHLRLPLQCGNAMGSQAAGYTKTATCQYGDGLNAYQSLRTPIFPGPFAGGVYQPGTKPVVRFRYQKQMAGSASPGFWISDGIGSTLLTQFPDNTGVPVIYQGTIQNWNWPWYSKTVTNQFRFTVQIPVMGTGPGLFIDDFEAWIELDAADAASCATEVVQIALDQGSPVDERVRWLLLHGDAVERTRLLLVDRVPVTMTDVLGDGTALAPASEVFGAAYAAGCQVWWPEHGIEVIEVPPGVTRLLLLLPALPPGEDAGQCLVVQLVDLAHGGLSEPTPIPLSWAGVPPPDLEFAAGQ